MMRPANISRRVANLGEGGEGAVFLVNDQPGSVMKIWHPGRTPPDADAKLSHLLSNPVRPDLGASWQITWPQHLVRENGVTVGYTMPILDPGQSWEPIVDYYNRRAAQNTEQEQGRELRIDDRVRMAPQPRPGLSRCPCRRLCYRRREREEC